MTTKKRKKTQFKYTCEKCDYYSNNKCDYSRHLQTKKHNTTNTTQIQQKNAYFCLCGKKYTHRASLYNHKKKCDVIEGQETKNVQNVQNTEIVQTSSNTDIATLTKLVTDLVKTNQELQTQLIELAKEPKTIIKNQTNNNSFNLNNFLNIQCKDAMNLSDFLQQIQLTIDDLLYLGNHGFIESFKNTFVKQLKDLDQTKRPIHCTDQKRKAMVVKENDTWHKDDNNELLGNAVSIMNKKQLSTFSQHSKQRDPSYMDSEANQIENSNMIINMCSYNEHNKEKIHKDLLKQIASNTSIKK